VTLSTKTASARAFHAATPNNEFPMYPNDDSPAAPDRSRGGRRYTGALYLGRSTGALSLGPRPPPAALNAIKFCASEIALDPPASATFFQPETSRTLARFFRMLRVGFLRVFRARPPTRLRLRFRLPFSIRWLRLPSLPAFSSLLPRAIPARLFSRGPRPRSLLRDLHASHVINVFRGRSLLRRFRGLPPRSTGSCER